MSGTQLFLVIVGPPRRQRLQQPALDLEGLAPSGIGAPDHLVNEAAVGLETGEKPASNSATEPTPRRFRYRGLSPLIAGKPFRVAGAHLPGSGIVCWTQSADGRVCMEAEGPLATAVSLQFECRQDRG